MTDVFEGWPRSAFDVLLQLEGDPPVSVREALRRDRENLVRKPMVDLLNAVADHDPAYEDFAVWRYGEVIMSAWQRQGSIVRLAPNVELAVGFDLDGLEVRAAWWYAPPIQIERYRLAVASQGSGRRLVTILNQLEAQGFELSGDQLKRPLRGYPPDHPRAELLRHRSLLATRHLGCDDWLHTPDAADQVLAAFTQLRPLANWLVRNVAESHL
ncbi:DUF2461 family protein [Kribbella endophytica]